MKPLFPTVAIVGLGLMGGSIALELKKKKLASCVIGVSRSNVNRKSALKRRAVDEAHAQIGPFLARADLVVLATPVRTILPLLKECLPHLGKNTLVTDVGSAKGEIVREASKLSCLFIGGHPIAGTERSGMDSATLDLFKKKKWILTPTSQVKATLRHRLMRLIRALGSEVLLMDPDEHDKIFAAVSHLPNLLAYTLMNSLCDFDRAKIRKMAGSSLLGMTRVASSPPEMWRDILLSNRVEVLRRIFRFEVELKKLKNALQAGDEKKIFKFLAWGKKLKDQLE